MSAYSIEKEAQAKNDLGRALASISAYISIVNVISNEPAWISHTQKLKKEAQNHTLYYVQKYYGTEFLEAQGIHHNTLMHVITENKDKLGIDFWRIAMTLARHGGAQFDTPNDTGMTVKDMIDSDEVNKSYVTSRLGRHMGSKEDAILAMNSALAKIYS